jgi:organic hydroperoxide reductase OsmC/OhrA
VAEPRAKRFDYGVSVDPEGRTTAEGATLEMPPTWTPEHLVLAGLVQCSLTSLRYHARRAGVAVEAAGSASSVLTKRDTDGRYAFVEIACRLEVALDPKPGDGEVAELLAKAERDCFVAASLRPPPTYVWNVA